MGNFHKDVAECDRIIRGLQGRVAMLEKQVREQSTTVEQRKKDARAMKLALSQGRDYIAILEGQVFGQPVSFADGDPRMRTVPIGWLHGLRDENRMLRSELEAARCERAS
jgi:hypothetical protein